MKKTFLLIFAAFSLFSNAQVVVLHPVKVSADDMENFLEIETNYSVKIAQDAVNNGDLIWWGLLRTFNTTADDYNFLFVNVYKDIETVASDKANWWQNSERVVGAKPSILFDGWNDDVKFDRRYFYKMQQQIESNQPGKFVIFNFGTPENVNLVLESNEKYIIPGFKKNMKKSGMTGWGAATKITPQGSDYSSFMTFDAFDTMANLMKHLSGDGAAIKGIDFDKIEPITFDSRYVFEIISATSN